jgi:phosphate transport system substrate-binding protein
MKFSTVRAVLWAAVSIGSASLVQAQQVTGAGASFPAPLYAKWADAYNKATGARINYQSVGSSAGMNQIRAKTVDFGASDIPLSDEALAKDGLVQFPTVMGGVVPVVNIPGIEAGQLKLNGKVLGDIFLGKITKWNHADILALNAGVKLPDESIAVVHRADGSGTSFLFTNYLSKVNADWKAKVGEGPAVNWPVGAGGKGNEGVSSYVKRLAYSIGYVEYSYAKVNKMAYTKLRNQAGTDVAPDDSTFQAAAASADWKKTFFQVLTEQAGKDAWPITGATFIVMQKQQANPANAAVVLKFFDWAYAQGDKMSTELDFVSMPDEVENLARQVWSEIKSSDGQKVSLK